MIKLMFSLNSVLQIIGDDDFILIFSETWDFIAMLYNIGKNTLTGSISVKEKILAL